MIKVEVIEDFKYAKFDKIKDTITRYNPNKKEEGKLYVKDTFECDEETCEYLTGKNPIKKVVVQIIEIAPEIKTSEEKIAPKVFEEHKPNKKKKKK